MMVRPSLLLMSVLLGALPMAHSQKLKPLMDSFEIITDVVIPCGSQCVVTNYSEVLQTTDRCITSSTGLVQKAEQRLKTKNIIDTMGEEVTYQRLYFAIFSEGSSPLCGWYRTYGGCLVRGFGQNCGSSIKNALITLYQNVEPLICSQNPNYLGCASHPSLYGENFDSPEDNGPVARCFITLANNFEMNIDSENYYNNLILRGNGEFLFNILRTFVNCAGDAMKAVTSGQTGCSTAGEYLKKYMNDAFDYFHFGLSGKDYLKCFAKPALHVDLTECGKTFEDDLKIIYGDSFWAVLNLTLVNGNYRGLQRPYTRLSSCIQTALNVNCGGEQDSVTLVTRVLHPLDHLFGIRSDIPAYCSVAQTVMTSMVMVLCGLLMFLTILLRQE